MKTTASKTGFSKMKATYMLLCLTVIVALGSYGWHLFTIYQAWQRDTPRHHVERLIRDLRRYYAETKRFPANFHEINQRLWHTKPQPDYGANGREARVKNYLYRYTQVESGKCVLWALPMGPQREYGAAFFVVITPEWIRAWKGKALSEEKLQGLPAIAPLNMLADWGLTEFTVRMN